MSVGFSAADFDVIPNGDQLPLPVRGAGGVFTYTATLMFPSRTQYNTMESYLSDVEVNLSMGGGAFIVITSGAGKRTLTYPVQDGTEQSSPAILTDLSGQVRMTNAGYIQADATFVLVDS